MGKYMIIRKKEYEFMKDETAKSNKQYLDLIGTTNNELENIKATIYNLGVVITNTLDQLKNTETARKKNASKIGGLTTSLNKEKKKTEELLNTVNELEDTIELQKLESEKKDTQIKILKNAGKQKQMEDYKKLQELNQDIQKHKKVK